MIKDDLLSGAQERHQRVRIARVDPVIGVIEHGKRRVADHARLGINVERGERSLSLRT